METSPVAVIRDTKILDKKVDSQDIDEDIEERFQDDDLDSHFSPAHSDSFMSFDQRQEDEFPSLEKSLQASSGDSPIPLSKQSEHYASQPYLQEQDNITPSKENLYEPVDINNNNNNNNNKNNDVNSYNTPNKNTFPLNQDLISKMRYLNSITDIDEKIEKSNQEIKEPERKKINEGINEKEKGSKITKLIDDTNEYKKEELQFDLEGPNFGKEEPTETTESFLKHIVTSEIERVQLENLVKGSEEDSDSGMISPLPQGYVTTRHDLYIGDKKKYEEFQKLLHFIPEKPQIIHQSSSRRHSAEIKIKSPKQTRNSHPTSANIPPRRNLVSLSPQSPTEFRSSQSYDIFIEHGVTTHGSKCSSLGDAYDIQDAPDSDSSQNYGTESEKIYPSYSNSQQELLQFQKEKEEDYEVRHISPDGNLSKGPSTVLNMSSNFGSNHWVGKDFNRMYQETMSLPESTKKYQVLSDLANDFIYAVKTWGKIIITERFLPNEHKTIKPANELGGIAGGEKFLHRGIMFKYAIDTFLFQNAFGQDYYMYGGLSGPNDDLAVKAAKSELKSLVRLAEVCKKVKGIFTPLIATLDFHGYRLICITQLPIDKSTIIYGSSDGGSTVHNNDPVFNQKMKQVAFMLNLKKHLVKNHEIYGPGDIEGHKGYDGRYYLIDTARVFPPESIAPELTQKRIKPRSLFYEFLRPELCIFWKKPLCSDAFSKWQDKDPNSDIHNQEITEVTAHLFDVIIPQFAEKLDSGQLRTDLLEVALHSHGINFRHMGYVRSFLKDEYNRKLILTHMWLRILKRIIRSHWRMIGSTEVFLTETPYKKSLIQFICQAVTPDTPFYTWYWTSTEEKIPLEMRQQDPTLMQISSLKYSLLERYGSLSLTSKEKGPSFSLERSVIFQVFWKNLAQGFLKFVKQAKQFAKSHPRTFIPGEFDLVSIEPLVKHMGIIDYYEGTGLLIKSREISKSGRIHQALRVSKLGRSHLKLAWESNSENHEILYKFGIANMILSSLSLKAFPNNPQVEKRATILRNMSEDNLQKAFEFAPIIRLGLYCRSPENSELDPLIDNTINRVWENVSKESDIYLSSSISLDPNSSGTILSLEDFEKMWKNTFKDQKVIEWPQFRQAFLKFLGIKMNVFDVRLQFLKRVLRGRIDQGKATEHELETINYENVIQLWDLFSPIYYGHDLIKKIFDLSSNSWFYICSKEWIPKILKQKPPNRKFMVRLGDSKGTFDIVHQTGKDIQHYEVKHQNGYFIYEKDKFDSLQSFLENKLEIVTHTKMQQRFIDN